MLRVRGYMEMRFTCNLVNVQTMHGIYNYRHPDAHHNVPSGFGYSGLALGTEQGHMDRLTVEVSMYIEVSM